ncbi:tetratricopeptide repeat protein [bacterium]|nr:tetratricopeptide repeat protein [bacterium]
MRGQYEDALHLYLTLNDAHPDYLPFYDGVIRAFIATAKYSEGLAWTDSLRQGLLLKTEPDVLTVAEREQLGNLIVDSGRFLGKIDRRDEALERWETLYDLPHVTSSAFYRLFSAMIDIRYPEGLEDMIARARKTTRQPTLLGASLANFFAQRGQIESAVKEWLNLLELQPRQDESIKRTILGLPDDEITRQQVESALKKFKNRSGVRLQVTEILGEFYFRSRDWEKAYQQVREADLLQEGSGAALIGFAENLLAEGESTLAVEVLADLEELHPQAAQSTRAMLVKARNLEAMQAYAAADSLFSILTSMPLLRSAHGQTALLFQARLRLEKLYQPEAARDLLEDALKKIPRMQNPGEVMLLVGDTYLAERNLPKAQETYLEAAGGRFDRQAEFTARALVNAGLVDYYAGNFDAAMERLKEASARSPNGLLTNNALDLQEMLRTNRADSLSLELFAQAELEERLGDTALSESLYLNLSNVAASEDLIERAILNAARLELKSGDTEAALLRLIDFVERYPRSLRATEILLQIGDLYLTRLSDSAEAAKYYEKILIDYPDALQAEQAREKLRELEHPQT